jgi:hypothetical protein
MFRAHIAVHSFDVSARNPGPHGSRESRRRAQYLRGVGTSRPSAADDRVLEPRRGVALARHFREAQGRSIAQIAERLGRSPATIKAYLYDPTDANKGPTWEREAKAGGREVRGHLPAAAPRGEISPRRTIFFAWAGCPAHAVGLGF